MEKCPTMIRDDIEIQSIAGSNASSLVSMEWLPLTDKINPLTGHNSGKLAVLFQMMSFNPAVATYFTSEAKEKKF